MTTALFLFFFSFIIIIIIIIITFSENKIRYRNVHLRRSFWPKSWDLNSNKVSSLLARSRTLFLAGPYVILAGPDGFFRPCSRHRVRPSYADFLNSFAMKARAGPYGSCDNELNRTKSWECSQNNMTSERVSPRAGARKEGRREDRPERPAPGRPFW